MKNKSSVLGHYSTQNKKATRYIGKQGQLLRKLKDTEDFFIMLVKADRQHILKFHFISF